MRLMRERKMGRKKRERERERTYVFVCERGIEGDRGRKSSFRCWVAFD